MPPTESRPDHHLEHWKPRDRLWQVTSALAALGLLSWVVPALMMANRGFSLADEGTYVVTYRDWANPAFFESDAQYFYGPLFHLLGESIPWLRVARVIMAIAANAWWGWAFVCWFEAHRQFRLTVSGRVALVLVLTTAGGPLYLWSPLTPGYYDLTTVITLALAALMVRNATHLASGRAPGALTGVIAGMLGVMLTLTKWPAITVLVATELVTFVLVIRSSRRRMRDTQRHLLGIAAGVTVMALVLQAWVHPIVDSLTVLARVTGTRSGGSGRPTALLQWYVADTASFLASGLVIALPAVLVLVIGMALSQRAKVALAPVWPLAASLVLGVLPLAVGWRGGGTHGRVAFAAVTASLLLACAAGGVGRGWLRRGRLRADNPATRINQAAPVLICMVLLPVLQALGTSVPLIYEAMGCLALWVAALIVLITGPFAVPRLRLMAWSSLATAIGLVCALSGTTTLLTPFKTNGYADSTTPLPGVTDLRVSAAAARQYSAVASALAPHLDPTSPTPFYTLDRLSGLVYLLHGRVIGSPWTDASAPARSASILTLACQHGDVDPDQAPVVLSNRVIDGGSVKALQSCGFPFPQGYVRVSIVGGPPGLMAWVERARKSTD